MTKTLNYRKLPPLKSLKGFESTARQLSFRKAAVELNLTHPAISHQIQSLEQDLGVKLFNRDNRQMSLTAAGLSYYPIVREALETLINGSETIRRSASPSTLRVQTYVSTSIRWLARRLPRFTAQHPELDLQIISCIEEQDFNENVADIGIVFCLQPPGLPLCWSPLFKGALFAVCSPTLIPNSGELRPEDLLEYPLIEVTSEAWQWHHFFKNSGVGKLPNSSISVNSTVMAIEMAIDGEGITLVNGPFADRELAAGRLVRPTAHCVTDFGEWGLVCRQDMREQHNIQAFRNWLLEDFKENT